MVPPAPPAHSAAYLSLSAARGHLRPLLIFAPDPNDPRLATQCRMLANPGFAERDVIIAMPPSHAESSACHPLSPAGISEAESALAHRRFHVDPGKFTIILVGKDGGEKFTSNSPVEAQKLFDLIDAMPMRRDEMSHPREPQTP